MASFVEIRGVKVHYKLTVPQNGCPLRTIVLLHGFMSGLHSFSNVQQLLSDQCQATVISYDRIAFGFTERPLNDPEKFSNRETVAMAIEIITRFKSTERVALVGHSAGGTLAVALLSHIPGLVDSVCLVDAAIINEGPPAFVRRILSKTPKLCRFIYSKISLPAPRAYFDISKVSQQVIDAYKGICELPDWTDGLFLFTTKNASFDAFRFLENNLHNLNIPIGIFHGEADRIVPISESKKIHRLLQGRNAATIFGAIKNCGHIPQEEHPTVFIELVKKVVMTSA